MKKCLIILFVLFLSCNHAIIPDSSTVTIIEVEFQNEFQGNFSVQKLENNSWVNIKTYQNLNTGDHKDTIPFVAGLYRIWSPEFSSPIYNIK